MHRHTIYEYFLDNADHVAKVRAEFLRQALTTARADREKLQHALRDLCKVHGRRPPSLFVWFDSPPVAVAALQLLREFYQMTPTEFRLPTLSDMSLHSEIVSGRILSTFDLRVWLEALVSNELTLFDLDAFSRNQRRWSDLPNSSLMFMHYMSSPRVFRLERLEAAARDLTNQLRLGAKNLPQNHQLHGVDISKRLTQTEAISVLRHQAMETTECFVEKATKLLNPNTMSAPNARQRNRHEGRFENVPPDMIAGKDSRISYAITWSGNEGPLERCHSPLLDVSNLLLLRLIQDAGMRPADQCRALFDAFNAGGWWWVLEDLCVAVDNPETIHAENGSLHHDSEAALTFPGWNIFSVHGVAVPEKVVRNQFSVQDIQTENNVEVRRVMVERFGPGNYIEQTGAKEVHRDECGILYRAEFDRDEPLVVVQVTNKTPEPDGSYRTYHLRVPPHIQRAREAVAWSFRLEEADYSPQIES